MTKVIRTKAHIIIAALLSIMVILTALPMQYSRMLKADAAGFVMNNKNIYFDISNLPNKDEWHSNGVYIQIDGQGMHQFTRIPNSDIYYYDFSNWGEFNNSYFILLCGNNWDTINAKDNYRTIVSTDVGVYFSNVSSNGKYCCWSGKYRYVNGKKVYDLDISNSEIIHTVSGGSKRIYFDATFSKLTYKNDNYNSQGDSNSVHAVLNDGNSSNIPYTGGKVYYYISDNNQDNRWWGEMTQEAGTDYWYVDIDPSQHKKIRFTAWANPSNDDIAANGDGTALLTIPTDSKNVFFADTGDSVVYVNNGGNRGGYWGTRGDVRDAEAGKNTDVVPVPSSSFTENENVLYLNSTFYDYYSDFELNGRNRVNYPLNITATNGGADKFASHRNWVPFRQLAQALSSYYSTNSVPANNTIYTGHFQPNVDTWGYPFSDVAETLNLYGWSQYNANFQVNNNSVKSLGSSDTTFYRYATQGILKNTLDNNGNPVMNGTTSTVMPFFDEAFLGGSNSKNAKLGEVYNNVAFPFTKVDRDGNGIYYWSFDSAATTLRLNSNSNTATNGKYPYYLKTESMATITDAQGRTTEASRAGTNTNTDRQKTQLDRGDLWSKNLISAGITERVATGVTDYPSNKYGFFPLNDTSINESNNAGGAKYNYGFGTKLEFDFTLSNNGNITVYKNNQPVTAATTFNFSGDDDVWVFIDGKLVLDIGGDHGRTSGCINFSKDSSYNYTYSYKLDNSDAISVVTNTVNAASVLVSEVKNSTYHPSAYSNLSGSVTQESLWSKLGITTDAQKTQFYKDSHTLTFFYMERGMWESNMRLQFNFPDNDTLEVEKTVDTSTVENRFKNFFNNVTADFEITNLVTHYGAQSAVVDSGYNISQGDIRDYGSASGTVLKPAAGAYYTKNGVGTTRYTVSNTGGFTLGSGDSALFANQFRRGSYIGLTEKLSENERKLYTTTWAISENNTPVTSYGSSTKVTGTIPSNPLAGTANSTANTGYGIDDGRIEQKDSYSGGTYNGYNTAAKPQGSAIVFRSYEDPDASVNITIKAAYTNRVNTGKLELKKQQASGSEDLTATYGFTITFSNIGGVGLTYNSSNTVTVTQNLQKGQTFTLDGIPVNTEYTIVETIPDNSVLDQVTGADSAASVNLTTRTVTGVISYDSSAANKGETDTIIFLNKKGVETVSIDITKIWDRLGGTAAPSKTYLCLERTTTPDSAGSWAAVAGYSKFELTASTQGVTVVTNTNDTKSWKYTIDGLDKSSGGSTYYYRIREYDSTGTNLLPALGKYNTNFTVSYSAALSADDTDDGLTVTNTYTTIVMPETGVIPFVNLAVIGVSAVALAVIALLIYKKKLQSAEVYTDERRRS